MRRLSPAAPDIKPTSVGPPEQPRSPASAISAERFSSDGALLCPYGGRQLGSVTALCPAGNRIYVGISGAGELRWIRI